MKVLYGKIGRSWRLDPSLSSVSGGDVDVARTLHLLARARPQDEFILIGRNSGENPQEMGYPPNVTNPWTVGGPEFLRRKKLADDGTRIGKSLIHWQAYRDTYEDLFLPYFEDAGAIVYWAGQHGTSNMAIPSPTAGGGMTTPQDSFIIYCSYMIEGLNRWRDKDPSREEMWLCPDPRNYLKARDVKWPTKSSVISQFEMVRDWKHERFGHQEPPANWESEWDTKYPSAWRSDSRYTYDALEMTALPHPARIPYEHVRSYDNRIPFGMVINENRAYVSMDRLSVMQEWVLPAFPDAEIYGKWSPASLAKMDRPSIAEVPYAELGDTMQRWRSTFTTPASGSGWATAKPWECFAYGTVCFFHPAYDKQNHILNGMPKAVRDWLRVPTAQALEKRVNAVNTDPEIYRWLADAQRKHYEERYTETQGGTAEILRRLEALA